MSQSMIIYYIPGSGALSEKCGESKLYPPTPLKKGRVILRMCLSKLVIQYVTKYSDTSVYQCNNFPLFKSQELWNLAQRKSI